MNTLKSILSLVFAFGFANLQADQISKVEDGNLKKSFRVTKCQKFYKLTSKEGVDYDLAKSCKSEIQNNKDILIEFSTIGGQRSLVFNANLKAGGYMNLVRAKDTSTGKTYEYYKILADDVLLDKNLKGYKDIKISHDLTEIQIDERTNAKELVRRIALKAN